MKNPTGWSVASSSVRSLSCLFGDPSTYKSFLAVDLAACIATGKDFHGHAVRQGPVVYIAGEGQRGIRKRFKAWELVHGIDLAGAPVFLAAQPADLVDERALQDLIAAVQQAASVVGEPCLIVFDTLARSFGSGDENSSQDMNTLIASSDRLRAVFGCAVLFVHHSGIADKGRGRGSSVLRGALDSEFRMDKDPEGVCIIAMEVRELARELKDPLPRCALPRALVDFPQAFNGIAEVTEGRSHALPAFLPTAAVSSSMTRARSVVPSCAARIFSARSSSSGIFSTLKSAIASYLQYSKGSTDCTYLSRHVGVTVQAPRKPLDGTP